MGASEFADAVVGHSRALFVESVGVSRGGLVSPHSSRTAGGPGAVPRVTSGAVWRAVFAMSATAGCLPCPYGVSGPPGPGEGEGNGGHFLDFSMLVTVFCISPLTNFVVVVEATQHASLSEAQVSPQV